MKWFVLATLLLGNILYFGWELDRETRMAVQGVTAMNIPAAANRLSLVSELDVLPDLRDSSALESESDEGDLITDLSGGEAEGNAFQDLVSELPDVVELEGLREAIIPASCFSFGPIPDELQANNLAQWFSTRNAATNIRYSEEQARQLLWIYLAPQHSRQTALQVLDELKGKGISDYRLISHGNLRNAISLGLFSSQAAVNNRLGELRKKGYKPVVVPYANVRRIYWIDVLVRVEEAQLEQILKGRAASYHSAPVDCSEIAIAPVSS